MGYHSRRRTPFEVVNDAIDDEQPGMDPDARRMLAERVVEELQQEHMLPIEAEE